MAKVLLKVMKKEVKAFGIEIKWDKTKVYTTIDCLLGQLLSTAVVDMLKAVDAFTYLFSQTVVSIVYSDRI